MANQLKIDEIGEVGKSVKENEVGDPKVGKLMKKVETGDLKVQELVNKIQMNDPKVRKVGKSARFGQVRWSTQSRSTKH